jgi:hypothetical protein
MTQKGAYQLKLCKKIASLFLGVVCIVTFLYLDFFFLWREAEDSCTNYMIEKIIEAVIYFVSIFPLPYSHPFVLE